MRYWTTEERRILAHHYPLGGADAVMAALAEKGYQRTRAACVTQAALARVRYAGPRPGKPRVWPITDALDARIVEVYRTQPERGAVLRLARAVGYPHWWIKRRAAALGVARVQRKSPPWSAEEIAIVREHRQHGLDYICRRLRAAGFTRTRGAVGLVLKRRLKASPRPADRYTGVEIARMLGIDTKTVSYWLRTGMLDGARRGTARLASQGGDMWWVRHDDLRRFIVSHPERVDLRKVTDSAWLIRLIAGDTPDGRHHRRKKPEHHDERRAA